MKTVIFLTNAYPYLPGEQFIEDEISYWGSQNSIRTILVPLSASGTPRNIPKSIEIDLTLAQTNTRTKKIINLIPAILSKVFWKEVKSIISIKGLNVKCLFNALLKVSSVLTIKGSLVKIHSKIKKIDVAYSYWNEAQCYAAVSLKQDGLIKKVYSRAHRYDLYEEQQPNQYMPLKRQFTSGIDLILAISDSGKSYLQSKYLIPSNKICVSRLGVPIPSTITKCSSLETLNILSISFCAPIKRIDKIIDAIREAKKIIGPETNITWTHIGGGQLLEELKSQAQRKLTPINITWNMTGSKTNTEVKDFFKYNDIDIFINTSESEGVPVSIMEAMSYGVPTIAPNVGGISEIVSNKYGHLLSETPSTSEVASAIVEMSTRCKESKIRLLAKEKIEKCYNAEKNYKSIVELIEKQ